MMMIFNVLFLVSLVVVKTFGQGICTIGHEGSNSVYVNGNWTYQGIDSYSKNYWYHEIYDAALQWGRNFASSYTFYVISNQASTGVYAYCYQWSLGGGVNYPLKCTDWRIWDPIVGENGSFVDDSQFLMKNCSYFTKTTDCKNAEYLSTIGISSVPEQICISNATYRDEIIGSYTYSGCDNGLPYYTYDSKYNDIEIYIHYQWGYGAYYISNNILSLNVLSGVYAGCFYSDILKCNQHLTEYIFTTKPPTITGYFDNEVLIKNCTNVTLAPTNMPTPSPTKYPTISNTTDVCIVGRYSTVSTSATNIHINGKYTYAGYDSDGYEYWENNCDQPVSITFNTGDSKYYLEYSVGVGSPSYFGYCNMVDTLPYECDNNWFIYDDYDYFYDEQVYSFDCSQVEDDNDNSCYDASYIDFDISNSICISSSTYREELNGIYEFIGCDEGFPSYLNTNLSVNESSIKVHFDLDCAYVGYVFGDNTSTLTGIAACDNDDLFECSNNLAVYDNSAVWQSDTNIIIEKCPTSSPTDIPTNIPTITPSNEPTIVPSNIPSNDPTITPSNIPTFIPSYDPTMLPTSTVTFDIETTIAPVSDGGTITNSGDSATKGGFLGFSSQEILFGIIGFSMVFMLIIICLLICILLKKPKSNEKFPKSNEKLQKIKSASQIPNDPGSEDEMIPQVGTSNIQQNTNGEEIFIQQIPQSPSISNNYNGKTPINVFEGGPGNEMNDTDDSDEINLINEGQNKELTTSRLNNPPNQEQINLSTQEGNIPTGGNVGNGNGSNGNVKGSRISVMAIENEIPQDLDVVHIQLQNKSQSLMNIGNRNAYGNRDNMVSISMRNLQNMPNNMSFRNMPSMTNLNSVHSIHNLQNINSYSQNGQNIEMTIQNSNRSNLQGLPSRQESPDLNDLPELPGLPPVNEETNEENIVNNNNDEDSQLYEDMFEVQEGTTKTGDNDDDDEIHNNDNVTKGNEITPDETPKDNE